MQQGHASAIHEDMQNVKPQGVILAYHVLETPTNISLYFKMKALQSGKGEKRFPLPQPVMSIGTCTVGAEERHKAG